MAELNVKLAELPQAVVVLMDGDGGRSRVSGLDFVEPQEPGAPAEVILAPSINE